MSNYKFKVGEWVVSSAEMRFDHLNDYKVHNRRGPVTMGMVIERQEVECYKAAQNFYNVRWYTRDHTTDNYNIHKDYVRCTEIELKSLTEWQIALELEKQKRIDNNNNENSNI